MAKAGPKTSSSKPHTRRKPARALHSTSEFDVDSTGNAASPMFVRPSSAEKARPDRVLARARRKPGRPPVGAGAKRIQVTVERSLLQRADDLAERENVTRAEVIARGLRLALAS